MRHMLIIFLMCAILATLLTVCPTGECALAEDPKVEVDETDEDIDAHDYWSYEFDGIKGDTVFINNVEKEDTSANSTQYDIYIMEDDEFEDYKLNTSFSTIREYLSRSKISDLSFKITSNATLHFVVDNWNNSDREGDGDGNTSITVDINFTVYAEAEEPDPDPNDGDTDATSSGDSEFGFIYVIVILIIVVVGIGFVVKSRKSGDDEPPEMGDGFGGIRIG